jgi:RimJ/RimL family protein N-acetyltransferase
LLSDADGALVEDLNARDEVKRYIGRITLPQHPRTRVYVIEEGGISVGVVGLVRRTDLLDAPDGYQLICALTKTAEGRHLGTIACATVLDLESTTPPHGVFAIIHPTNEKAKALARTVGFAPTERATEKQETVWFRPMTSL